MSSRNLAIVLIAIALLAGGVWVLFARDAADAAGDAPGPPPPRLDKIFPTPGSFDHIGSASAAVTCVTRLFHEPLAHFNPLTQELDPGLAESWNVSEDLRTWTFYLQSAATPDGIRLTAQDVVRSVERQLDPQFRSSIRANLIVGGQPVQVEARGDRTVVFRLAEPRPFFAWVLAGFPIVPDAVYGAFDESGERWRAALGKSADPGILRGFGPFYVENRNTQRIVLRPNPNFYGKDDAGQALPRLDEIVLTLIDDPSSAKVKFLADTRFSYNLAAPLDLQRYRSSDRWITHELGIDGSTMLWWLNQNSEAVGVAPGKLELFRSVEFRRALGHLIHRDEIIEKAFFGEAEPLFGPISPVFDWAMSSVELRTLVPQHDPQEARSALAALGVYDSDGDGRLEYDEGGKRRRLTIRIYTTPSPDQVRETTANLMAQQLRAGGIDAEVEVLEFNNAVQRIMKSHDYEAFLMFLESSGHVSNSRGMFHSSGRMHFPAPSQRVPGTEWEKRVDLAFDLYVSSADPDLRARALRTLQKEWVASQTVLYLVTRRQTVAQRSSFHIEGAGLTGRAYDVLLDRPFVERVTVRQTDRN